MAYTELGYGLLAYELATSLYMSIPFIVESINQGAYGMFLDKTHKGQFSICLPPIVFIYFNAEMEI